MAILSREQVPTQSGTVERLKVKCNFCGSLYETVVRTFRMHDDHRGKLLHAAACCDRCRSESWRRVGAA